MTHYMKNDIELLLQKLLEYNHVSKHLSDKILENTLDI